MITDKQVDALREAINDYTGCILDPNDLLDIAQAYEKAAWRPISEIPDDEMLMVLAEGTRGFMVWRARMLYWQQHGKTPAHLQFGATRFRVIGKFDAPISGPLPKGPSDE